MITRVERIETDLLPAVPFRVLTLALQDESVMLGTPATIQVQINEETVATVVAEIGRRQGAEGGWYPAVKLRMKENSNANQ